MASYRPTRTAYRVAVLAIVLATLLSVEAIRSYLNDNESLCGGGLGRIGPGYTLVFIALLALLATLVALVVALVAALRGRRWIWSLVLVATVALGILGVVASYSEAAHTVVGAVLGFGCSQNHTAVAFSLIFLLISLIAFVFLFFTRRLA